MTGLKTLWDEGRLAIVRGVGYPKPDHSHFRSMDIWQTALARPPGQHRLDRPLAGRDRAATRCAPCSVEPVLPPLLAGATPPARRCR